MPEVCMFMLYVHAKCSCYRLFRKKQNKFLNKRIKKSVIEVCLSLYFLKQKLKKIIDVVHIYLSILMECCFLYYLKILFTIINAV